MAGMPTFFLQRSVDPDQRACAGSVDGTFLAPERLCDHNNCDAAQGCTFFFQEFCG
jgi:hypothetical protein